jgi:hypothetical protein
LLQTKVVSLLQDAQPILLPTGQQLAERRQLDNVSYSLAFFLPEVCNLPLGMRWPTSIGFADFSSSIKAALGKSGDHFISVLTALQPSLEPWFTTVALDHVPFLIQGKPFLSFYDKHFRDIRTGTWPPTILDQQGFSPLADMLHGFVWRLWCDRVLTTGSSMDRTYLHHYLQLGTTAITSATYLGAAIPARFCPNFAFHFQVSNGWPTDSSSATTQGFLHEFEHDPLISWQAQQHDRISVDLHEEDPSVIPPLQTKDQRSSADHRAKTPRSTRVPTHPMVPRPSSTLHDVELSPLRPPRPSRGPHLPTPIHRFIPSPPSTMQKPLAMSGPPPNRALDSEIQSTIPPIQAGTSVSIPRFDPIQATIYTHAGRQSASDTFLNCCRLVVHHTTSIQILDPSNQAPLSSDYNIFVREPCRLFRSEILQPLTANPKGTFFSQFQGLLEAILRSVQVTVASTYAPAFFTASFLTSLYSVESWMVSPHIVPASVPPHTFHVYKLLTSLPAHADSALSLPPQGLTLLEAKHLGIITYYLFAMIDLPDTLQDTHFRKSVLGARLKAWSVLPDNPNVHSIWNQYPGQATYQWFQTLQHLLNIIQTWIKWLRFHKTRGFLEAHDSSGSKHLLIDNQVPSPIPDSQDSLMKVLQQFDVSFQNRWYQNTSFDGIWSLPLPPAHFRSHQPPPGRPPPFDPDTDPLTKKQRLSLAGEKKEAPDFINNTPLVEAVVPFQVRKSLSHQILTRLARAPFPKFTDSSGTLTLCFLSAFAAPHNCCVLRKCVDRKRKCRLHVDIGVEPWRSKPESFWEPLVQFLKDPAVSIHLKPAPALRKATPSARWS